MPGESNISSIKTRLSKIWGLGPSRSEGVLLLGTTMEPAKRLGSEAEVDAVVSAYAQRISRFAGGASSGGVGRSQAEQEQLAAQHIELYMRHLKRDSR
jgi:fatty acid synthase subunit alpha, fungi type